MHLKLITIISFIISWLCILINALHFNKSWDNDIYTGRQFEDLVTKTHEASPEIIKPALLVMYSPSCDNKLDDSLHHTNLPPFQFMVLAKYDYETSPKHIWYHLDDRDNLILRYKLKSCIEYLYFAKGMMLYDEPERYRTDFNQTISSWLWKHMEINLTVVNNYERPILVQFRGKGPNLPGEVIQSGDQTIIKTYTSYFVLITDIETQSFLLGQELQNYTDSNILVPPKSNIAGSMVDWLNNTKQSQEKKSYDAREIYWRIALMQHLNIFQPVMFEKFTKLGYKKDKIPNHLYKELIDFYSDNKKNREPEYRATDPIINHSKVKCSLVQLSDELVQKVGEIMKPILEKWCNCDLVLTYLYGIREYYKGNILMHHVDKMDTHIVSAILQIDQELDNQPDWELEIIGFDGKRKNVTLQPGELLLYESATLIHGRPYPFQGKVFANAFLHFKPVIGWNWKSGNGYITNNNEVISKLDIFASPLTYEKKPKLEYFIERLKKEKRLEL